MAVECGTAVLWQGQGTQLHNARGILYPPFAALWETCSFYIPENGNYAILDVRGCTDAALHVLYVHNLGIKQGGQPEVKQR